MGDDPQSDRGFRLNGPRIKELRKRKGWTQAALAACSGFCERTIGSAEQGNSVDMHTWTSLADCLDVEKEALLPEQATRYAKFKIEADMEQVRLSAKLDRLVDLLAELSQDISIEIKGMREGCVEIQLALTTQGAHKLFAAHERGELASRLRDTLGFELIEGPQYMTAPALYREPVGAKDKAAQVAGDTTFSLAATISDALGIPANVDFGDLMKRYLTRIASLPEGAFPEPMPAMRGDVSPLQASATIHSTLIELFTGYDRVSLRMLDENDLLDETVRQIARHNALDQGMSDLDADAYADALVTQLRKNADLRAAILNS